MEGPRIAPVERFDDAQHEALAKTLMGEDGRPMNVFKTLAHRPKLLRRVNALGGCFVVHGSIPVREREIVILRTAARAGSAYELAHHRRLAAAAGLTAEEVAAAIDPAAGLRWAARDRALLDLVDELTASDTVSDATWTALAPFGNDGRLELLVLVGHYRLLAGVLNAVGVEIDASPRDHARQGATMSETDATRDKDRSPAPAPEPSTQTAPGPQVQEPADAQRFAEPPPEGEAEQED